MRHSPRELVEMMPKIDEIVLGMSHALNDTHDNFEQFEELIDACHQARVDGREDAIAIPAVRFAIDSTLATSNLPEVSDRLPDEIHERATVGRAIAATIANIGIKQGIVQNLLDHYRDPIDRFIAWEVGADSDLLARLSGAPIYDSAVVIGGSCRLLLNEGYPPEEARKIIKRSGALLVMSGVDAQHVVHASGPLGYPYTESDSLEFNGSSEPAVSFTGDAKTHIRKFAGVGCPAGDIKIRKDIKSTGQPQETTLLEHYWGELTDYLITDRATTDEPVVKVSEDELEYITLG